MISTQRRDHHSSLSSISLSSISGGDDDTSAELAVRGCVINRQGGKRAVPPREGYSSYA
jgi:hypothetical protein